MQYREYRFCLAFQVVGNPCSDDPQQFRKRLLSNTRYCFPSFILAIIFCVLNC